MYYRFIATELCCGTLEKYVKETCNGATFESDRELLLQITKGLAHLHQLEIVHRDIKPTNILIFFDETAENSKPLAKLADFGISKILETDKVDFTNTNVANPNGTRGWMPPEVFKEKRFDFTVDVWALGCIFAYTLSVETKHPFGDDANDRLARIIRKEPMLFTQEDLKESFSNDPAAFELIKAMLEIDPAKRPTIGDVENSYFFTPPVTIDFHYNSICNTSFTISNDMQEQRLLKVCKSLKDSDITLDSVPLGSFIYIFEKLARDDSVDVHVKLEFNNTLLHTLCGYYKEENLIDLVQLLLEKGAEVNTENQFGATPLHYLSSYYKNDNQEEILQLLDPKGSKGKLCHRIIHEK